MLHEHNRSLGYSMRCLSGSGLGGAPLHHIVTEYLRYSERDAAGIAAASLAGDPGMASVEASYVAAARDGAGAIKASRRSRRSAASRLMAFLKKLFASDRTDDAPTASSFTAQPRSA